MNLISVDITCAACRGPLDVRHRERLGEGCTKHCPDRPHEHARCVPCGGTPVIITLRTKAIA